MRQKRVKSYKKQMQMYVSVFKFREPFQILLDSSFILESEEHKVDVLMRLADVCQGLTRPMIPQCTMQKLYDSKNQSAIALAKTFERRKCGHLKAIDEEECFKNLVKETNPNRYTIATLSGTLRRHLRTIPGVPIIYQSRSVVLLENPSAATTVKKEQFESSKLHMTDLEKKALGLKPSGPAPSEEGTPEVHDQRSRKKRGPKGPNPLSIKRTKKNDSKESAPKKRKADDGGEGAEAPVKRKRKRSKKPGLLEQNRLDSAVSTDVTA